jgi:hypothetical protein
MLTNEYSRILAIHSYWRWLVLLAGVAAVVIAALGVANRIPFLPLGRRASTCFIITLDVQLVLGLWLYAISPIVRTAWANMAAAMKQHDLRFFVVEHTTTMLIAIVVAHVGSWRAKRALDDRSKYRNMLGWYVASLAVILIGIPWWRPWFRS